MSGAEQNDVRCYRSPKIEVRPGGLEGRGVFAKTQIEKDEVVAIKAGHVITIVYVAMCEISPGEKLCHDYSMERADDYSLECRCGSKYCRGRITGDDWKRHDLQGRYEDRFSSYILEKIKNLKKRG